jgi:hypothetical protein
MPVTRPLADRLADLVDRSGGDDACWPFLGCVSKNRGAGPDAAASYSADEVAELVRDAVPDVGFSKTALEKGKVLRKHPELIAAGKVSTSYEFRAQKAGAVDVVEVA